MKTIMHSPQTLPLNACAVRARWLAPIRKFFLILATLGAGGAGQAADVVWDGGLTATGTTWLAAENWAGDLVPGDNDNAIFDSVGTVTILGIDMNTALSTQRVDSITLGPGRAASNLTIRNSSTTTNGFLQLNGSSGTLLSNATSLTLSINNGTSQPMGLGLAASGDIFVSGTQQGVGGIISISSSISDVGGPRSINKVGGGTLYLRGVNSFSGNLTNVEGSLQVDATGTFGAGTLYLNGGDIVCAADRSGGAPLTNPVVMSANCFVINNAGTVGTSRTIPFSGPWSGNAGTLTIANNTAALNNTFQMRMSGGFSFGRDIVLGSPLSGSFALLQLYNSATNGDQTFTGTISTAFNAGSGSVWRSGAAGSPSGTTIFTGNNTYDGGTRISYGTLLANNTSGSALGFGPVTVTNAGVLGGNGTISAPVTVNLAGTVSPGASVSNIASLAISDLTLGENGVYVVQVSNASGAAGSGYDSIAVSGNWTDAASSSNAFTIKLDSLGVIPANWNAGIARNWTIIDSSSATAFDVSHFSIDTSAFLGTIQGVFSLSVVSGDLVLTYTPAADIVINVTAGAVNQGQTSPTPYPILTGTFGVVKVGNGEVVLTNALNDYVGSTRILAGTASLAVDALNGSGAFGAAATSVLLGNTTGNSNATLNINSAGVTMGRNITVQSGSTGSKSIGTTINSGVATFSGDVLLQTNVTLTAAAGGEANFSGLITGSGGLTKSGAGTVTVSAANSYTGDTALSNGPVILNGRLGTGTLNVAGATPFDATGASATTLNNTQVVFNADVIFLGTTNLSFGSGAMVLSGSRTFSVSNNTLTVNGVITGPGGLTKNGPGTLALTAGAGSSYAGNTTLNEGLTTIGPSTGLGLGTLNLAGGSLGLTGTRNLTTGILPNALNLTADTVIQNTTTAAAGTRNLPFGGAVTASAGTLTIRNIAAANTNVMHLRLHGGGINFTRPVVFDNSTAGNPANNTSRLGFYSTNGTGDQVFSGVISGPGAVTRSALDDNTGGTTILSGANTFTLGATLDDGALGLGADTILSGLVIISSPIGTGTFEWTGNSSLFAHGAPRTLANFVYLNGVRDAKITGTNALTFAGFMDVGTVSKAFTIDSTAPTTITGVMTNTAPLTKGGAGVLVLSGPNQNSGGWTVTNGTLLVNGTSGSGDIVVTNTGILGGTGTIAGAVTVESGGTLAPGASIGTLTISSNLTLIGNALFELNKSVSPSNDVVVVAGTLTNAGTGTITVNNLGPALTVGDSFKLFSQAVLNGSALTITTPGVVWVNNLQVDGSIQVSSVGSVQSPNFPPGAIGALPTGNISLTATGAIGSTYKLWASTNVALTPIATTWTLLSSGTVTTSPFVIQDLGATNYSQRFYRFSAP